MEKNSEYGKSKVEALLKTLLIHELVRKADEQICKEQQALHENKGWIYGSAYEFLGLSEEEIDRVDARLKEEER